VWTYNLYDDTENNIHALSFSPPPFPSFVILEWETVIQSHLSLCVCTPKKKSKLKNTNQKKSFRISDGFLLTPHPPLSLSINIFICNIHGYDIYAYVYILIRIYLSYVYMCISPSLSYINILLHTYTHADAIISSNTSAEQPQHYVTPNNSRHRHVAFTSHHRRRRARAFHRGRHTSRHCRMVGRDTPGDCRRGERGGCRCGGGGWCRAGSRLKFWKSWLALSFPKERDDKADFSEKKLAARAVADVRMLRIKLGEAEAQNDRLRTIVAQVQILKSPICSDLTQSVK